MSKDHFCDTQLCGNSRSVSLKATPKDETTISQQRAKFKLKVLSYGSSQPGIPQTVRAHIWNGEHNAQQKANPIKTTHTILACN